MQENFIAWGYAPKGMRFRPLLLVLMNFWLIFVPLKIELRTLVVVIREQLMPGIRAQGMIVGLRVALFLLQRRIRMVVVIAVDSFQRVNTGRAVMKLVGAD
jgi:hypothetical protein